MSEPTIVSMFYDIREKDKNKTGLYLNKRIQQYCELAKKFILSLPYNLIIFTDNEEVISVIESQRSSIKNKTYIYKLNLLNTYFYKDLTRLEELQSEFIILNGNLIKDTPLYIVLTNNKFDFIEKAIELNPFNSSHFIWMDFGINHVAKNTELIHEWINFVPDKIKQLCINPYIENIEPKRYFKKIYHNCAAGLFSGSKENLLKYVELFKQKTEQIYYNEGWYQLEEALMTIIQRENIDLFDFYYGDYEGIISNYLTPVHSFELINKTMQKCLKMNNTIFLYKILIYLDYYFSLSENQSIDFFYTYITNNIICNYYQNNKCLRPIIIELINKFIEKKDDNIIRLLKNNSNNINFYLNKNIILSFDNL